jgi:hypothetical protein
MKLTLFRSRESRLEAEVEFLSSTSEEVCELWSGNQIVRMKGKQAEHNMKTVVITQTPRHDQDSHDCNSYEMVDASKAYKDGLLVTKYEYTSLLPSDDLTTIAPSLTFTVPGININLKTMWALSIVAVVLQVCIIMIPALATYLWKWPRKDVAVAHYAYGCYAAGTVLTFLGLFCCGYVVERSTEEYTFYPHGEDDKPRVSRILRVQLACNVGSQEFSPYAILNDPADMTIRTSRFNKHPGRLT